MYKCTSSDCPKYPYCAVAHSESGIKADLATMYKHNPINFDVKYKCGPRGDYALYEPAITKIPIPTELAYSMAPSRVCAICDGMEDPSSETVKREFWMCSTCSQFFKEYMQERMKEKNQKLITHIMKHHD